MTGLEVLHPAWLAALAVAPVLWLAWRRWPPALAAGRRRPALGVHVAVVVLLVLALADVQVRRPPAHRAVVAVVDLSDSVRSAREMAADAVRALAEAKGPEDVFGVVTFGQDAQVEVAPTRRPRFGGFQTRPEGSFSDLAAALRLGANLLPDGYARQLVLVSDGRQTLGDAPAAVAELRARQVRVEVVRLGAEAGTEAAVSALDAPHQLRAGQDLSVTARLSATAAAAGRLVLSVDGAEVQARNLELPAGASEQVFELGTVEPGTRRLAVRLDAEPDASTDNDVAEAVVRVLGRPEVLVLEGRTGGGANVVAALAAAGMRAQTLPAVDAPTDQAVLARFDAVVVADAPAEAFPAGALAALAGAVRDLGRGLVAIGGNQAYGPGGWKDTPLEDLLPVRMDPPRPREMPAVAVVLALETMESFAFDAVALGAAEAVIDQLRPTDELGVINMDYLRVPQPDQDGSRFLVPLGRVNDKAAVKAVVEGANLGDPPAYSTALGMAYGALRGSTAAVKHVILIGDGDALGDVGFPHAVPEDATPPGLPDYGPLFAGARAAGITTSVIGENTHGEALYMDHMRAMGEGGGGRFYLAETANDVPLVLLGEARSTLRPWFEEAPFFPTVTSAGDVLAGVDVDAFPELGGYVVSTPKPGADLVLSAPKGDPVLATGQAGLGRTVAWTSDAEGRWTGGLLGSPVGAALLGRMVAWSLPTATDALRIDTTPAGDGLELSVTGPADGGDLAVQVAGPGGGFAEQQLRPVAPGRWQGQVPAPALGTYVVRAVLTRNGLLVGQADASVPVPYSAEYRVGGGDNGLLARLAGRDGALLARPADAWSQPRLPLSVTRSIASLLLAAAALLWPLDVALRRLTVGPGALVARLRGEWARHRPSVTGTPAPAASAPAASAPAASAPAAARPEETAASALPAPQDDLAARLRQARRRHQDQDA